MQHIGVDIIEIDRIEEAISRWGDRFLAKIFTPSELNLYRHKSPSLAARFAAKEAVMKTLDAPGTGIGWRDIEILSTANGKPTVNLTGKAQIVARQLAIKELAVSLSHSDAYAVAFVVGTTG